MIRGIPPRAIARAAAGALLLAIPCAAQNLPKSSRVCAPTCPPTEQTTEASEAAKPHPKIIIDDVIFDGPTPPPDSQATQRVIDQIKHDHWGAPDWLDEILQISVLPAWQEEGYFKAAARGQSQIASDDGQTQHVVLIIRASAGMQYRLGTVTFRTPEAFRTGDPDEPLVFPVAELRRLISLQEGDVFNVARIRESLDAMHRRYAENGYINFVATPVTEVDDSKQRISLIFELDQGRQFRINKVEVHGLDPGREATLLSKLRPGDIWRNSVFQDAVQSLAPGLNLSDEDLYKSITLRKSEKSATVTITVDLSHPASAESQPDPDPDEP